MKITTAAILLTLAVGNVLGIFFALKNTKIIRLNQNSALVFHPKLSAYEELCLKDAVKERVDHILIAGLPPSRPKFLLWGDSAVFRAVSTTLLGVKDLVTLGLPGQQASCAKLEVDTLLTISPRNVILYFGANEADKAVKDFEEFKSDYEYIVDQLTSNNIRVYVHLVHYLDQKIRAREDVDTVNYILTEIAQKRRLTVINSPSDLDFKESKNQNLLSYDGEMLKPLGYLVWFRHLEDTLAKTP